MTPSKQAMHLRVIGLVAFVLGAVLLGAAWYARPIRAARRIGIDWRATLRRSRCYARPTETFCTTEGPGAPPLRYVTLQFNPITRSVHRVMRVVRLEDSVAFQSFVDSARGTLDASGGTPVPCDTVGAGLSIQEARRLGDTEVRLIAGWGTERHSGQYIPVGYAAIVVEPWTGAGCGREVHYRLLTPREIAQHIDDWFLEHAGF